MKISVILCTAAFFFLGCADPEQSKRKEVEIGKELAKQGKTEEARIRFQKSVSLDANYAEAHYQLGLLELRAGKPEEAHRELSQAAGLDRGNRDARVKAADLALAFYASNGARGERFFQQAEKVSNELLQVDANDYDGLRIGGYQRRFEKRDEEAIALFRKAQAVKPNEIEAVTAEADALRQLKRGAEARTKIESFLAAHAQSRTAYDYLYRMAMEEGRQGDARRIAELRVEKLPPDLKLRLELCGHYATLREEEAVQGCVGKAAEKFGASEESLMSIGRFYAEFGRYAEALQFFERVTKQGGEKRREALLASANALLGLQRGDEALQKVNAALEGDERNTAANVLKARLLASAGRWDEARAILNRYAGEDAALRKDLARINLAKGERKAAIQELQLYLSRYGGDTSARETLGGIYDEDRQYQAALEQADMALSLNPSSAQAQLLRSRALMGLGRTAQARREIEKGLESGALSGEFSLQRGFLELAEGKYAEAETSFRKAYQAGNRDLRAVSGLVEVAFARQQPAAAVKIAQGELAKSEAPEATRAWVASVAARAGQYDLAMREYQTAIAKRPDDANLYLALGEVQRRKGDGEAAQKAFAAAKAKAPESSAPELALGLEALGGKDWASAERHFRRAVEIDAASVAAKNNLAYALAEQNKNLDEALRLAIQASAGKNPNYEDTLAYVYLKRRDFGAALRIWERLAAQAPKAFGLQLRMAEAKWGMGDKEGAARILEGVEKTAMSNEERALVARMRGQMR